MTHHGETHVIDASQVPRFAGVPTFMRLPLASSAEGYDVVFTGIPYDGGTTNRSGARHGPREMRNASSMMRQVNANGIAPYQALNVADIGDCPVNPFNVTECLDMITAHYAAIAAAGAVPITAGGDHLVSLPILRGLAAERPVGLIHFDSHTDTGDAYFGKNRYTHGTPFRRAVEEGLIDSSRTLQIGLRGSLYSPTDYDFAREAGFRLILMDEAMDLGPDGIIGAIRERVGDGPVYVSFDIDCLDPSVAPGTGTPEAGGFLMREAQKMVRGLNGLDIIGADVVEVSPPFDVGGITSLAGATMMFELLCAVAAGEKA